MEFKGITVGTYISRKSKNKKEKDVCASCEISKKIQNKNIDKEKEYALCKDCNKCYVSKTSKAVITTGRDLTTGKVKRKTFVADTEEQAFSQALQYKLNLEENGGIRVITRSNKTLVELIKPLIDEQYKLKAINQATHKRKSLSIRR